MVKNTSEYVKDHIFELRRKMCVQLWWSCLHIFFRKSNIWSFTYSLLFYTVFDSCYKSIIWYKFYTVMTDVLCLTDIFIATKTALNRWIISFNHPSLTLLLCPALIASMTFSVPLCGFIYLANIFFRWNWSQLTQGAPGASANDSFSGSIPSL